jgi:hypothetical protein
MNDNAQKLNAIVGALLILASVLGVAVLGRGRSGSPHPPQTASESVTMAGSQTIPSRLTSDFAPNDRRHIGVEHVGLAQSNGSSEQKLALERFIGASGSKALVPWLPEEDFAEDPLRRLDQLCEALGLTEETTELVVIASIVETCRRPDINLRDYLRDVPPILGNWPITRVGELTPTAWKAAWTKKA